MKVRSTGCLSSPRVALVGEAPGVNEELKHEPFVGPSGQLLDRMLHEAGVERSECFIANVCRYRPPGNELLPWVAAGHPAIAEGIAELKAELQRVKPKLVIALGAAAAEALATGRVTVKRVNGKQSMGYPITHWRGSQLYEALSGLRTPMVPTLHPAAVLRQWSWKRIVQQDFRRALRPWELPNRRLYYPGAPHPFNVSFDWLAGRLRELIAAGRPVSFDLETRSEHIVCAGIGWSPWEALCIPFIDQYGQPWWSEEQEVELVRLLNVLLTKVPVWGQNLLYDSQYTWRRWRFIPKIALDTMIGWHSLYSQLPKSLDFIASMLCRHYVQWKGEGEDSDNGLWHYNCLDCCYTYEASERLLELGRANPDVFNRQQRLTWPVLTAMVEGVKVDRGVMAAMRGQMEEELRKGKLYLEHVAGHPLNPRSPKQLKDFFYGDLKQQPMMKDGRPTLNEDALMKIGQREPLLRSITGTILDMRSAGVYAGAFLDEGMLDADGRMRCAYNIGGSASGESAPYTYRLSSNKNAFGTGGNLQTVPSKKSKSQAKAAQRGSHISFPVVRKMFVPDEGMTFFNGDLDRADLQVVVWEAGDEELKAALRAGVDMHLLNAFALAQRTPPPPHELIKPPPDKMEGAPYTQHLREMKELRERAKQLVHSLNYAGGPRTIAIETGQKIAVVEETQRMWFAKHPKIKAWHQRTAEQIRSKGYVENKFGYRWVIFDRLDEVLPEALAWQAQSTVAVLINRIWQRWYDELPEVHVLGQVHDSLYGQFPTVSADEMLACMVELARIEIPYNDPLIIPFSINTSLHSWGACDEQ